MPPCPGSPSTSASTLRSWTDCFGIWTISSGVHAGYKYVGEWKDGEYHGQGTSTFDAPHKGAGEKYVGEYRNSKRNGQGTYTFDAPHKNAGEKYVGEWKDGTQHGQGTYTYADGRVNEGIWENGKFLYAKKLTPTN